MTCCVNVSKKYLYLDTFDNVSVLKIHFFAMYL